jgi:hypothetical protein
MYEYKKTSQRQQLGLNFEAIQQAFVISHVRYMHLLL